MFRYLYFLIITIPLVFAQSKKYEGPEDAAGDIAAGRDARTGELSTGHKAADVKTLVQI